MRASPLSGRARQRLGKTLRAHGTTLRDVVPHAWARGPQAVLDDPDVEITLVERDDNEPVAVLFDRGWDFAADWVREIWLARVGSAANPFAVVHCVWSFLTRERATHLRWRVRLPIEPRFEAVCERLGAEVLGIQPPHGAGAPQTAVFQLGPVPERRRIRSNRNLVITRPRVADLPELIEWSQDEAIRRPLGYDDAPSAVALRELLFGPELRMGTVSPIDVYSIRMQDRLVGVAIEYDWDFSGDSTREIDIALPGLERPSPLLLLDSLAALMHGCFARGATHVLGNVRGAATGKGFPRLFTRLGGNDVTAPVRQFGRGQEERCYFAAPAEPFYVSAEGRKYAGRRAD